MFFKTIALYSFRYGGEQKTTKKLALFQAQLQKVEKNGFVHSVIPVVTWIDTKD